MGSVLALLAADARILLTTADIAAAMSVEALKGSHAPFDELVTSVRPHPGAVETGGKPPPAARGFGDPGIARRLRQGPGRLFAPGDAPGPRGQPGRPAARGRGARGRDEFRHRQSAHLPGGRAGSSRAATSTASRWPWPPITRASRIAELAEHQRTARSSRCSIPPCPACPAFLAEQGGLHSGLMISQYTAASLVSENKVLAHPASVDSIPTSANQEDHVSMGTIACRKARRILENVLWVLAIELVSGAQALDFHAAPPSREGRRRRPCRDPGEHPAPGPGPLPETRGGPRPRAHPERGAGPRRRSGRGTAPVTRNEKRRSST